MDTTFITIHDLSPEATILYCSDSIVDILGHTPDEVIERSSWDFFHPTEEPFARQLHQHGVNLDKAAMLAYCQIRNRQGQWVGCECCFSVVYDVMVVCTSIYHRGISNQKRAAEAPVVRRLFSSSPRDPRYHMLSHLSAKFQTGPENQTHEPRAALFLNRFTRTLTIMYATDGIEQILGISGENMKGRSFYYCIQENCLEDAVKCLETAKGNDSIAYLRFWFRDPRMDDAARNRDHDESEADTDESMTDVTTTDTEDEGGVAVQSTSEDSSHGTSSVSGQGASTSGGSYVPAASHTESGESSDTSGAQHQARSSGTSGATSPEAQRREPIELEAVVSCTSDGLVVCLRRARPIVPTVPQPAQAQPAYATGLFAAPWAPEPMYLPAQPAYAGVGGAGLAAPQVRAGPPGGPPHDEFMKSIRDVAVFAWALTGINGCLADYARGRPVGESQPPEGFPVWTGGSVTTAADVPSGGGYGGPGRSGHHAPSDASGDSGLGSGSESSHVGFGPQS